MSEMTGCAIITGASRGIGRAIALALAGYMPVVVNYRNGEAEALAVVTAIEAVGGTAAIWQADVADADQVAAMFAGAMGLYGGIRLLVNNAGITKDRLLLRMTEADFEQVIDVNLKGAFLCLKQASAVMLRQRFGRILNISSVAGIMGNAGQVNYSAAKAGMIGMTKAAARELASRNITVNAIAPGLVGTDMSAAMPEAAMGKMLEQVPLGRMGTVEEIAALAVFLGAEPLAGYITGQVICVDGGLAM